MTNKDIAVSKDLLIKLNQSIPRYTSYPTVPSWGDLLLSDYTDKLKECGIRDEPCAIYIHIPFCKTMCLFCACSVVLSRNSEKERRYVDFLLQEIDLVTKCLENKKNVSEVHFGGGTPTKLEVNDLQRIVEKLKTNFNILPDCQFAIEIDPRTVFEDKGKKLEVLKNLGFNRVSFGVQDTSSKVQDAIRRRQSYEMTQETFFRARDFGFSSINIDLIYGLPLQTVDTFSDTVEKITSLQPDRIALFSYAQVPWLKPHQKAIKQEDLPSLDEKFEIYLLARSHFINSQYVPIGMDHFSKVDDELACAYREKRLQRNFQGYSVRAANETLNFGLSSIGSFLGMYVQNHKELGTYYSSIEKGNLPLHRGKVLTSDDFIRSFVIERLMCDFLLNKNEISKKFNIDFNKFFAKEMKHLKNFETDGLVEETESFLKATPKGELFIRNIACCFDAYVLQQNGQFSKAV